ncbi:GDP-mannose 4,6-dehydratase [Vreelandella populi]|uniref:UDP-glucose 4-epimerase n=1 Tax=Vreelandella populi TaxID=2498858 RepID=A0A3S0YLB1_9GAMM|nr:GDP-mannose 4,6-dehydratase [Halomonas populi]RUR41284.1 NAD-dependent epimerase/dehydratase family protein [Halomonas populi]RUR44311.1 NAD-dependent epimerase/dehydratase family protein [Halomonas populi]
MARLLVVGCCGDKQQLNELFFKYTLEGVLHFASLIQVVESVIDPAKYYMNNMMNTLALLQAMKDDNVDPLFFSSMAADPFTHTCERHSAETHLIPLAIGK